MTTAAKPLVPGPVTTGAVGAVAPPPSPAKVAAIVKPASFQDMVKQRGDAVASSAPQNLTLTISGAGLQGSGKTLWGLRTMPTPLLHLNFDRDANALFYVKDREGNLYISKERQQDIVPITLAPELFNPTAASWDELSARMAKEKMEQAIRDYIPYMDSGTIMLDGGAMFNNLVQVIELSEIKRKREAKDQKLFPFDYANVNTYVNGLLGRFDRSRVNFYMTHHLTEDWGSDGPVGTFHAQQNSQVPRMIQVELWFWGLCGGVVNQEAITASKQQKKDAPAPVYCRRHGCSVAGHQGLIFNMKVRQNKLNTGVTGYTQDNLTFEQLYFLTFGKSYQSPVKEEDKKEEEKNG